MRPARSFFYVLAVAFIALQTPAPRAMAQDHQHHHPRAPGVAAAKDHYHPPGLETELHEKFYSTWYMPDEPAKSCCNKADCYPTEVKFQNGQWHARRREDGTFVPVPWKKVEQNRDNPDGRNHVCMPPPTATYYPPNTVFCFSLGAGI
jgi:hypothetical protein